MVRFDKNLSAEKNYNNAAGCHCECCSTSTHYTILHFYMNLSVENYTSVDDCRKFCSTSTQCCVLTETCLGRKNTLLPYFLFWEFKMVHFDRKFSGRNYNYVDDHNKCCSTSTQWCFLAGSCPESVTILPDDSFQPTPKRGNSIYHLRSLYSIIWYYIGTRSFPNPPLCNIITVTAQQFTVGFHQKLFSHTIKDGKKRKSWDKYTTP